MHLDHRRLVHESKLLIDDADVVDRDPVIFVAPVSFVDVTANNELRPDALDRRQELAAAVVFGLAGASEHRQITVTERRLMRHEDVDTFRNQRVNLGELFRLLHERPVHERIRPGRRPDPERTGSRLRINERHRRLAIDDDLKRSVLGAARHVVGKVRHLRRTNRDCPRS